MLGLDKGMFISDEAREKLLLPIPEELFKAGKEEINKLDDPNRIVRCWLTKKEYRLSEGLFIPKEKIADSIDAQVDAAEQKEKEYKEGWMTCNCGKKLPIDNPYCEGCSIQHNVKDYWKKIHVGFTQKTSLRLLAKYMRGKTTVK